MIQVRNNRLDNMRALLIFLVVTGHLSEVTSYRGATFIREFIYLIHMPGFALLSGFFWKGKTSTQMLENLLYPYIVFQTIYLVFDYAVLGNDFVLQYTRPYWILWYLMSLMAWQVLTSILPIRSFREKVITLVCALLAAVCIGYDKGAGYSMSLSRTIVFFPFFLCGVLARNRDGSAYVRSALSQKQEKILSIAVLALAAGVVWKAQDFLKISWLYHSLPYAESNCPAYVRAAVLLAAYPILWAIYVWIPNRELPLISHIGRNTMPVYLLHGFITRWIGKYDLLELIPSVYLRGVAVIAISLGIVFLLSAQPVIASSKWLMRWPFSVQNSAGK